MYKILIAVSMFLLGTTAFADQTIVTPSGYTMASGDDVAVFRTVSGQPRSITEASTVTSNIQLSTAYLVRPGVDRISLNVQSLILPETFQTPAASIGISDLANSTGSFRADGFNGRSIYVALSKSLDSSLTPPKIHGITLTGGLGSGGYHGLFGGASAQLPLRLLGTAEFDGRSMNYRLADHITPEMSLSLCRIGDSNWLTLDLHSKMTL